MVEDLECWNCGDDLDSSAVKCVKCEWWCARCADTHFVGNMCEECMREMSQEWIHPYSYAPQFQIKGNPEFGGDDSAVLMGVELEVGSKGRQPIVDAVHAVDADETHLYMKEEGSIEGVEIVTHPMTLAWARQYPFDKLLCALKDAGAETNESVPQTCSGDFDLHVHVDRRSLESPVHALAWLQLLYGSQDQLQQLVGRAEESVWATWNLPRHFDPNRLGPLEAWAAGYEAGLVYPVRYSAVNCMNRHTFEVRFFRSSLELRIFYAALEFVHASIQCTRAGSADWGVFAEWVRYRRADYPSLWAEMSFRNFSQDEPHKMEEMV